MKIRYTEKSYTEVASQQRGKPVRPHKPNLFFRTLLKVVSQPALIGTKFKCERVGMERLGKKEPALFLMNHSSFIDLEIFASILYPRPFNIVTTTDGFIGKEWLMRTIGCFPTEKFVTDLNLVKNMRYALNELKSSVVLFPEAAYSFDGTGAILPDSLAKCVKMLGVPLVMIRTYGAFSLNPLYNNLQRRKVKVSAKMEYLLSPEEIKEMPVEEIDAIIRKHFTFDHFAWQKENSIRIDEKFRADGLERVLYKCPHCLAEGETVGKGTKLTCHQCGKVYELDEYGYLRATDGETKFDHIPDWYLWQRECVRKEIEEGTYSFETPVDIFMTIDTKKLYRVGTGVLKHGLQGFTLDGCEGKLHYEHKPLSSYSLNSDFFWYELGDIICVGTKKEMYYSLIRDPKISVAKAKMATEELYKIELAKKKQK